MNAAASLLQNAGTAGLAVAVWAVVVLCWNAASAIPRIYRRRLGDLSAAERRYEDLKRDSAPRQFDIDVKHGGRFVVWDSGPDKKSDVFWLIVTDLKVTNRGASQIPMEFWVFFGGFAGSMRWGSHAVPADLPEWVLRDMKEVIRGFPHIPSPSNVPPMTTIRGYIAIPFANNQMVQVRNEADARSAVDDLPLWVEVCDNLTGSTRSFALNAAARRVDIEQGRPDRG